MYLEIVSPEATLFSGEVTSVTVPSINGEFQMLQNHAPIVSLLQEGSVKFQGDILIEEEFQNKGSWPFDPEQSWCRTSVSEDIPAAWSNIHSNFHLGVP